MSKYIIEIAKEYEEYFKGVLICGIADGKFAVDVIAREDLEELNSDYINEHFGELQDEAYKQGYAEAERIWRAPSSDNEFYQKGLEDAWEATKKIFGYEIDGAIPIADIGNVFGYEPCKAFCTADILRDFTVQEAIAKLKAYEDKPSDRIEVGDEVIAPCGKAVVTLIKTDDIVHYLYSGGDYGCIEPQKLKKTGRHFDIQSILGAMKS